MKYPITAPTLLTILLLAACTDTPDEPPAAAPTELVISEQSAGSGAAIEAGQLAVVHYTGWLFDPSAEDRKGTKFDSSRDRNDPFVFALGAGQVITGWDEGVSGMRVGGRRLLYIPPSKAYGSEGAGGVIPPDATLVFDVELLEIR